MAAVYHNLRAQLVVVMMLLVLGGVWRPPIVHAQGTRNAAPVPYRSAILVDATSGKILFEHDIHERMSPGALTQMMVLLLIAEGINDGQLDWDQPVQTSAWASRIGGSQVFLKHREVFPVAELFKAVAIKAANDAAVALAEGVGGSVSRFVRMMNDRAAELGMHKTEYHNVHGLPAEGGQRADQSTAHDIALLARRLLRIPEVMHWANTDEAWFRRRTMKLVNPNELVRQTNWIDGLQLSASQSTGYHVVATAQRDGMRLLSVVMGAHSKKDSLRSTRQLLNQGFRDYHTVVMVRQGDTVANDIRITNGQPRFVRVVAGGDVRVLSRRGQVRDVSIELALPPEIHAPLEANAPIGDVIVREGERILGKVPAVTSTAVRKASMWDELF